MRFFQNSSVVEDPGKRPDVPMIAIFDIISGLEAGSPESEVFALLII